MCLTLETPWTVACQALLSMGFPRLEYWSGLPFPSPGDLPNPGTEPRSPVLQVDSLPTEQRGYLLILRLDAFSKSRLSIWKLSVHVMLKPSLEDFEHNLTSMEDECNCPLA